uniref:Uncharacterized protein n=1 Tax=Arundo donax TaxID=35708 RepID=A0A0A9GY82_ARUDO
MGQNNRAYRFLLGQDVSAHVSNGFLFLFFSRYSTDTYTIQDTAPNCRICVLEDRRISQLLVMLLKLSGYSCNSE